MPYSDAHKRAQYKYAAAHLKRVPLDVQQGYYETIKQAAERAGQPVNTYIKQAIQERIDRDSKAPE